MKTKFNREIKVGIMVIVAIFIFYFGMNFLKGVSIFQKSYNYSGYFENIDGLVPSAQVKIKGYKVGQVSDIKFDFSKEQAFTVIVSVDKNIVIPKNTIMVLSDDGLMGGKIIELTYSPTSVSTESYKPNSVLPTQTRGGLIADITGGIMPKIERVAEHADSLIVSLNKLIENPSINASLYSIEKTTSELAAASTQLKGMMNTQLPSALNDLNAITQDFRITSGNIKKIDFAGTMESADFTIKNLQQLSTKLNNNEGSLGLLLNDNSLYIKLSNTTESADKLLIDLKENPNRYVNFSLFGSKK